MKKSSRKKGPVNMPEVVQWAEGYRAGRADGGWVRFIDGLALGSVFWMGFVLVFGLIDWLR